MLDRLGRFNIGILKKVNGGVWWCNMNIIVIFDFLKSLFKFLVIWNNVDIMFINISIIEYRLFLF